jgi:hypothetical protein
LGLLLAAGCDRGEVRSYRAPKDNQPAAAEAMAAHPGGIGMGGSGSAMSNMGGMAGMGSMGGEGMAAALPQLHWVVPAGWKELPASQMRVGNFSVSGEGGTEAQVTIIPLSGQGGGDAENVNRWRSQVGQPRVDAGVIDRLAEKVEIAGGEGRMWDFAGEQPEKKKTTRLLAAIQHRDGTAWFFKMVGDDALVATNKARFVTFLKSVEFVAGDAPVTAAHASAPVPAATATNAGAAIAPAATPPPSAGAATPAVGMGGGEAKPAWTVPSGWKEVGPGAMQLAKFAVGPDTAKAEATVSVLPGDAGGRLPNVNRWRGQLGLPAIGDADLEKALLPLTVEGAQTYAVDLVAEATQRRMLAAAVSRGGRTWFFKLSGAAATVGQEKEAFMRFVRSVDYGS